MTQFRKQLVGVLSTGLLVANLLAPVAALATDSTSTGGTTLVVSGNGEKSNNNLDIKTNNNTTVSQTNTANVTNTVNSKADSGGNTAKGTTGGNVSIDTGNAKSDVTVANVLNKNVADVNCCQNGDTQVVIAGNGEQTHNKVDLDQTNANSIYQDNTANVTNAVDSSANSGKNKVSSATGGDVSITTGDATAKSDVSTTANANLANIGGNGSTPGSITLVETGNGEKSYNHIDLDLTKGNTIYQDNSAYVNNDVDAYAKTGDNTAKSITGGNVSIDTGNANSSAKVDNLLNSNAAFTSCDCLGDVFAKVSDNGEYTKNKIDANLGSNNQIWQGGREGLGNEAYLNNAVDANAKSGKNKVESTTGSLLYVDPVEVMTGNSYSTTSVNNTANENVYGDAIAPLSLPDMGVDFSFDLWHLWFHSV